MIGKAFAFYWKLICVSSSLSSSSLLLLLTHTSQPAWNTWHDFRVQWILIHWRIEIALCLLERSTFLHVFDGWWEWNNSEWTIKKKFINLSEIWWNDCHKFITIMYFSYGLFLRRFFFRFCLSVIRSFFAYCFVVMCSRINGNIWWYERQMVTH